MASVGGYINLTKPGSTEIPAVLRRDIRRGSLAPQERLPPGRVLAETYGVARGTIREALNQLARDGLVKIRRGSGTCVLGEDLETANLVIANANPLELMDTVSRWSRISAAWPS